ncbi:MAG: succinate dehydrogenase subunit C [Halieaceae bacterium]|nr:MAG: succinate dehydrogenase subunit C [Halieaceae bacterium]
MRSTSKDTRPVNLDLGTIQLPLRLSFDYPSVTGVLMFFASFLLLWALDRSLASEESFNALSALLGSALAKGVIWAVATVLTYHALAGSSISSWMPVWETMQGGVIGAAPCSPLHRGSSLGAIVW